MRAEPFTSDDYARWRRRRDKIVERYRRPNNGPVAAEQLSHPAGRTQLEERAAAGSDHAASVLLTLDAHEPAVVEVDGGWTVECSCGWSRSTSLRLRDDGPMPEAYAWAEHADHVRQVMRR